MKLNDETKRLIEIDSRLTVLSKEIVALEKEHRDLLEETRKIREKCAHPTKYQRRGWDWDSCQLCETMY